MTDPTPYTVSFEAGVPYVSRGNKIIGWTGDGSDADRFARELNAAQEGELEATRVADDRCTRILALQSENARLRARVARLEAVEKAARGCLRAGDSYVSLYSAPNIDARRALRAALEATDDK